MKRDESKTTEAAQENADATPRTALRALAAAHRRLFAFGLESHQVSHEAVAALAVAIITHRDLSPAGALTILIEADPTLRAITAALKGCSL